MRPDKHKKKIHAAYARKAAAKAGKSDKPSPPGAKEPHGRATATKPNRGMDEQPMPNSITQEKPRPLGERHQLEGDNRPSFSRRKIESNWQQYDEIPENEETVEQRGADFSLLLNQTVGAQFRFRDEETIDEDSTQAGISSLLSFDCNQLAEGLQSISLPERLQISRVFFDRETLEILDQDAAMHKPGSVSDNSKMAMPSEEPKTKDGGYFDEDLEEILSVPLKDQIRGSLPAVTEMRDSPGSVLGRSHSQSGKADSTPQLQPQQNKHSEDDVLDFLLSMSSKGNVTKDGVPGEVDLIIGTSPEKPETNGDLSKKETLSGKPTLPPQKTPSSAQTESLDDWLDSILDD